MARPILVVDDDALMQRLIHLGLTKAGYDVVMADNGALGLEVARTHDPLLILLDLGMPVTDGWEFLRIYYAGPGPHAPVVVCSVLRPTSLALPCRVGFLSKPFHIGQLLDSVRRQLSP
jgi:CheY-like chemotaxis protein